MSRGLMVGPLGVQIDVSRQSRCQSESDPSRGVRIGVLKFNHQLELKES